ncbi:DUF4402 domain-containing protein [Altererythrobacter sp. ZODW24]|uniref:DUF4402 domain-containing protein n=1 Tax=Altererythrobacter sp. ZODW24 TaxID=2185142 RepID=UPI000DF7F44E|nr:DUF4402 domain-containing protein [Altererythrobacter sp. ZODW24]
MKGWVAFLQSAANAGVVWHRTMLGALCLAAPIALVPQTVMAQTVTSAESEAIVVTPLSFIKTQDLDFGSIIPGPNNGGVTLDPDGSVTTTGGIVVLAGSTQVARFAGYGSFGQFVTINLDRNRYDLTRIGGTQTMRMRNMTIGSAPPSPLGTPVRTFFIGSPSGAFAFSVAGEVRVRRNQAPGIYEGQFEVTLEYQ